ncbi:MAG: hypothetical protein FJ202_11960 [Gemmatimonadetes bacterium]|nr:hypothetical protein [Gemmatimonadota bacterium]
MRAVQRVSAAIDTWATGRDWRWRAALLLLLVWQAAASMRSTESFTLFGGINFGAHEFGHLFFAFGGEWLSIAGGSLAQLLVPIGAATALLATSRDWFGAAVCLIWLGASFGDLAPYIADARAQELDLVSFSEEASGHDWHYLLANAGLLKQDLAVARLARFLAFVSIAAGVLASLYLFLRMAALKNAPTPTPSAP